MRQLINSIIEREKNQTAYVSKHIRGHVASFSDTTDTWAANVYGTEMLGLRENIGLLIFDRDTTTAKQDVYQMGRIDFGWYNQDNISVIEDIKTTRGGRDVTSVSYRFGDESYKLVYAKDFLSGRNSSTETLPLYKYNLLSNVNLISRNNTIRWNYYSEMTQANFLFGTLSEGLVKLEECINGAIRDKGWFTNFMHWHWWLEDYAPIYFAKVRELTEGENVYHGSYSDIGEYYFVSNAVDNVTYENGTVTINYSKKYPNSPYNKITVPLWVNVDLTKTSLTNKDISVSHGGKIRKISTNNFSISIALDFTLTSTSFVISETLSPNYINLNKPIVSISGNTVTADQNVKLTLFRKLKSELYEINMGLVERKLAANTTHTIDHTFDLATYDYYLGYINDEKISGVLQF